MAGLEIEPGSPVDGDAVGFAVATAFLHPGVELVVEDLEHVRGERLFKEQVAVTLEPFNLLLREHLHASSSSKITPAASGSTPAGRIVSALTVKKNVMP